MLSRKKKVNVKVTKEVFFGENCDMLNLLRILVLGKQNKK